MILSSLIDLLASLFLGLLLVVYYAVMVTVIIVSLALYIPISIVLKYISP